MSLASVLESQFRADIRLRGDAYLEAERVGITKVTPDELTAVVRDGEDYETQLSRGDSGELRMFCSCSAGRPKPLKCKHLWATILLVDADQLLTGRPSSTEIPPFLAEPEGDPIDDDLWDFDESQIPEDAVFTPRDVGAGLNDLDGPPLGDLDGPSGGGASSAASDGGVAVAARPTRKRSEWQTRLAELRHQMNGERKQSAAAEREREIFYELDAAATADEGRLVVQVSQRQRRANGQWGKVKPLKLRIGQLEQIEHEDDRRILSYLSGSLPERNSWVAQQSENTAATYRYMVPHDLAELLLPMMCGTGRVRLVEGDKTLAESLEWDDGEPWQFALAIEESDVEDAEPYQLKARVVRDVELEDGSRDREEYATDAFLMIVPGGLVVDEHRIARMQDFGAREWVEQFGHGKSLPVPEADRQTLVDELLDMPALPRLELPEELKLEEVRVAPQPVLTVRAPQTKGFRGERLKATVEFDYDGVRVPSSSVRWAIVQRGEGRCLIRDRDAEQKHMATLATQGVRRVVDPQRSGHDVEVSAGDLGPLVRSLINEGWEVRADGKEVKQAGSIQFRVSSGVDWFELGADIDFGGGTIAFPELLAALSRGDQTIRLDDGSLGVLPEEWIDQFALLGQLGRVDGEALKFSKIQAGLLDAMLADQESVDFDENFIEVRQRLADFDGVEEADAPEQFGGELRPYQRQGLGWMQFLQEFGFGGCLADDMGLGKTVQMLALFQRRKEQGRSLGPSLVVVPKSLLFNWMSELKSFTPKITAIEYVGADRSQHLDDLTSYDLVLTTYGTLRRDIADLAKIQFDYVVLDEAQTIKNSASQIAKASRLLKAGNRLALSGTPIENHLGDLWSIFEFLNPGMLGRSSAFKASASEGDESARGVLARGLRPFVLRRTKGEVASDLPEKVEETLFCEMEPEQRRLYDELKAHYRDSLLGMVQEQGINKSRMHVLEALLRLRQAACHPALLDKSLNESDTNTSAKLDMLTPKIEMLLENNQKSLIFSQFTSMLAIVREQLDERGIRYAYLDGQTRDRQGPVDEFQNDDDCGVFLISLKAGGLGLNLTAAEYVFLLDPWWNPAVEAQAIDRAHRVGQTKNVFAYRLICKDTVEEKILELQNQKRELAEAILENESKGALGDLTAEDLELLLS